MKKIVLTGSSGRIGRAIHFALSSDYQVLGIDISPASSTRLIADINDYQSLCRAFSGADAVVHTAALHAPHVDLRSDAEFERINVEGTKVVLRAARQCGIRRLIFTSTTALYGHAVTDAEKAVWINEHTTPQPRTIYHQTKLAAESYLQQQAEDDCRIYTIRMSRCFPEPAPVMAAYRLHRGVDARDVALAHKLALKHQGNPYECFIISGHSPFRPEDCVRLKQDAGLVIRARSPEMASIFDKLDWQLPESIDRVYDSSHAHTRLGWRQNHGFESVIEMLDREISEVLPAIRPQSSR